MFNKSIKFLNIIMWIFFVISLSTELLKAEIYDFDYEYYDTKYNQLEELEEYDGFFETHFPNGPNFSNNYLYRDNFKTYTFLCDDIPQSILMEEKIYCTIKN